MFSRRAFLTGLGAVCATTVIPPPFAGAEPPSLDSTTRFPPLLDPWPSQQYPVQVTDVEYRRIGADSLLARVYQPGGTGPFPTLLAVHGGQWTMDDRTSDAPIAQALAARGIVVFAPDFRNGSPSTPYPTSIIDVNYAVRWLKAHATEFNGSGDHLGGLGTSSGGHLIMLCAMRARDPNYARITLREATAVDASLSYLVLISPVLDPLGRLIFANHSGRMDIIRSTFVYFAPINTIQDASPVSILQRGEAVECPPTLIVHGTGDTSVPLYLQEEFAAAYRAAGGDLQLEVFPGQRHVFPLEPGPETDRAFDVIEEFIARQLAAACQSQSYQSTQLPCSQPGWRTAYPVGTPNTASAVLLGPS